MEQTETEDVLVSRRFLRIRRVIEWGRVRNGVSLVGDLDGAAGCQVLLQAYVPNVIRFRFSAKRLRDMPSLLLCGGPASEEIGVLTEEKNAIVLESGRLRARVKPDPWQIPFCDAAGEMLTEEVASEPWPGWIHKADVLTLPVDRELGYEQLGLPCGFVVGGPQNDPMRHVHSAHTRFLMAPGERLFGFGEKFGTLDKRKQRITMWQADAVGTCTELTYKNVPFFMISRGYGMFVHTTWRAVFHVGDVSNRSYSIDVPSDEFDLFCDLRARARRGAPALHLPHGAASATPKVGLRPVARVRLCFRARGTGSSSRRTRCGNCAYPATCITSPATG